jgi:hypothetical protein
MLQCTASIQKSIKVNKEALCPLQAGWRPISKGKGGYVASASPSVMTLNGLANIHAIRLKIHVTGSNHMTLDSNGANMEAVKGQQNNQSVS